MDFNKSGIRYCFNLILIVTVSLIIGFGCSSRTDTKTDSDKEAAAGQSEEISKNIESISSKEKDGDVFLHIKGNSELIYSAVREKEPDAVVLYFPDTLINEELKNKDYSSGSLEKAEIIQEEKDGKIRLFLDGDLPYEVKKDGYNLLVKIDSLQNDDQSEPASADADKDEPEKKEDVKQASVLKDIEAEDKGDFLKIKVNADGAVKKYNSFTLNNPPRIVYDLVNISSSFDKVQKLDLNNEWAKSLRHYDNNSRLRIVVDSRSKWLNNYGSKETDDGLEIFIGKRDEGNILKAKSEPEPEEKKSSSEKINTAIIKKLDFSALEDGSSKVIITTSEKIEYKAEKPKPNQLAIRLKNTKIPDYHQRPIITTRFDSAVNRVFPVYDEDVNKKEALVLIDLRENVAFKINDETDKQITVVFESSVKEGPEKSELEDPEWKSILTDSPAPEVKVVEEGTTADTEKEESGKKEKSTDKSYAASVTELRESEGLDAPASGQEPEIEYGEKKYTGQPITLDFYETDIKNVFRIIQHVSGLNFAIDKDVSGKVTMTLKQPVPWDQVLDLILKMNSLGMQKDGNIVRISQLSTLQAEEQRKKQMLQAEQESEQQEKSLSPLYTEYLLINYSNAQSEILPHLQKVLSDRGSLSVDQRNNQVILTDTREKIEKAKEIISKIDKITPQVVIEARIVEANSNFAKDIGTEWNVATTRDADEDRASNVAQPIGDWDYGYEVTMNTPQETGSIGVNFAKLSGLGIVLNAKLNAMETQQEGRIISAPKVVTLDNKKATIKQGYEYPYTTLEDGETTTEFKDVDLMLEVTPHVTADNKISLKVNIDKNDIYVETSDGPALSTKNVSTELLVNDGDTIVIGGIIQQSENTTVNSFPWLSKIPVLGWFFKSKQDSKSKQELLIFLTPRIVELEKGKF
ncbi:MAG: type IV pilus secretin PilQ [Thermodesulfobacteriota bacterium]